MANKSFCPYCDTGFTLIEILVALAVIAIAVSAVAAAVSGNVRNAAYIQDRTLAHWIGMNKIAEAQLSRDWPAAGTSHGESLMASQSWSWQMRVSTTDDADVRRLDVDVFADQTQKESLSAIVAYLGRPVAGAAAASGQVPP
jgi:general secretion pathway protein I